MILFTFRLCICVAFFMSIDAFPKNSLKFAKKEIVPVKTVDTKEIGTSSTVSTAKVDFISSTASPPTLVKTEGVGSTGNYLEKDARKEAENNEREISLVEPQGTIVDESEKKFQVHSLNNQNKLLIGDGESPYCPGVICSVPPPQDDLQSCKESWTTSINPLLPIMGSRLDCCPVHICTRQDGSQFSYYGIEGTLPGQDQPKSQQFQDFDNNKRSNDISSVPAIPQFSTYLGIPHFQASQQQGPAMGPFPPLYQEAPPSLPALMMMNMISSQFPRYNRNSGPFFQVDGGWGPWASNDMSPIYNPRMRRNLLQPEQLWGPETFYGNQVPMPAFPGPGLF